MAIQQFLYPFLLDNHPPFFDTVQSTHKNVSRAEKWKLLILVLRVGEGTWPSGSDCWSIIPYTKRLQVQSLSVPLMFLSLPSSLSKINKHILR